MSEDSLIMTPEEVSELTGISIRKLNNDRKNKKGIPYHKYLSKSIYYERKDVIKYMKEILER